LAPLTYPIEIRSLKMGCPALAPGFPLFGHSQKLLLQKQFTTDAVLPRYILSMRSKADACAKDD